MIINVYADSVEYYVFCCLTNGLLTCSIVESVDSFASLYQTLKSTRILYRKVKASHLYLLEILEMF